MTQGSFPMENNEALNCVLTKVISEVDYLYLMFFTINLFIIQNSLLE
jgi:hypothetical protein